MDNITAMLQRFPRMAGSIKRRFFSVSLVVVLFSCSSPSDLPDPVTHDTPYIGIGALAALNPGFPCSQYLLELNKSPRPVMNVLMGTFGNDWTCVREFLSWERDKLLLVYISNESCRDEPGRCLFSGEIIYPELSPGDLNKLIEQEGQGLQYFRDRIFDLVDAIGIEAPVMVALGLEDNFSYEAFDILAEIVPYPLFRNALIPNDYFPSERHSLFPDCAGGIWSNDGHYLSTVAGIPQGASSCSAVMLWLPDLQGITPGEERKEPLERTFSFGSDSLLMWNNLLKEYDDLA